MFDTKIINWGNSPKGVELKNNEIHFWIASLEVNKKRINYLKKILSTDEIKKIDRINIKDVNHRHIASRALLRLLLGNYYIKDKKPNDITFNYNRFGKPSLENGKQKLNFNLSHSGDFIIYAFIQGYNIGPTNSQIPSRRPPVRHPLGWRSPDWPQLIALRPDLLREGLHPLD